MPSPRMRFVECVISASTFALVITCINLGISEILKTITAHALKLLSLSKGNVLGACCAQGVVHAPLTWKTSERRDVTVPTHDSVISDVTSACYAYSAVTAKI